MRNTLAIGVILFGSVLILSAVKNWKMITTIQVMTGQKPWDTAADGGTITGTPTAAAKDRPGWKEDALEKNPDGTWKRDKDGYIIIKPGAKPFDPEQANTNKKPGEPDYPVGTTGKKDTNIQDNATVRRNIAKF